jgi:hypothetical protein
MPVSVGEVLSFGGHNWSAIEPETQTQADWTPPNTPALWADAAACTSPDELSRQEDWRKSMSELPLPGKGCFESAYPDKVWRVVPCKMAPNMPMTPRIGPRPQVIGKGNDISAEAPSSFISSATGSFDTVNNVTSLSSPIGNAGAAVNNAYTLQLNTNPFNSSACAGSPNPNCQGWEQFVYFTDGSTGSLFIQYWLLNYNATCPANWKPFQFTGLSTMYCFRNSMSANPPPPNVTAANLGSLVMTGTVTAGSDDVRLSTGTSMSATTGDDLVNAATGWTAAEFNVFGAGGNSNGGGQVTFNDGATVVPRARITYGGTAAPTCLAQGFTGETNNLNFGPNPPVASPGGPAVIFMESTAGGAVTNCAAATSIGDTHLSTFQGLLYDFQAQGDFVLADVDSEVDSFTVQVRQVSGAPNWPSAAVNHAAGVRMGNTSVAVCVPERLTVNGETTVLKDGEAMLTPDGVTVTRNGHTYLIVSDTGDSVRAEVFPTWMNTSVGLGRWPEEVRGLIANANGNVEQIAASDGVVLSAPFAFKDVYHHFADSWRVSAEESLLSDCGPEVAPDIPLQPFYAEDVPPALREQAATACIAAGVKPGPLFDACTLDVAVIGDDAAARVFVGAKTPVSVGRIVADTANWTAGVAYKVGDRVSFNGILYVCIQAHTSQSDWTPDVVPALWNRVIVGSEWQPQTAYATGTIVTFNGVFYQCVQGHVSQVGWEPPNTPALWSVK